MCQRKVEKWSKIHQNFIKFYQNESTINQKWIQKIGMGDVRGRAPDVSEGCNKISFWSQKYQFLAWKYSNEKRGWRKRDRGRGLGGCLFFSKFSQHSHNILTKFAQHFHEVFESKIGRVVNQSAAEVSEDLFFCMNRSKIKIYSEWINKSTCNWPVGTIVCGPVFDALSKTRNVPKIYILCKQEKHHPYLTRLYRGVPVLNLNVWRVYLGNIPLAWLCSHAPGLSFLRPSTQLI